MDKVKQILSQVSFSGQDIDYLIANKQLLTQNDLARLGLVPSIPVSVVEEPVKEVVSPVVTTVVEQSLPKKRGRPRKVIS